MLAARMYLCGPLNDISINCIAESIGRPYSCMIRDMMDHVCNQQDKIPYGTCKMYVRTASKTRYQLLESYTSQPPSSAQRSREGYI